MMKTKILKFMAMVAFTALPSIAMGNNPEILHLGTNNTLVKMSGNSRYIMMPVQESNEDATINVLVDGKLDRTIYVRLAKTKIDYNVPFDLTPYLGHDVIFNIVTSQNRSTIREAKEDICWRNFQFTDSVVSDNIETYRPVFHHTPLYGWMNDPNGMFYKDGKWHLYYQWNPYGSKWQNMTWGHSSSTDLINWEHHSAAIEPNGLGSVFSGSAAIDADNSVGFGKDAVIALYTSAGVSQIQSLACSSDNGKTFSIYPGNPVLTMESEARDPNMFWDKKSKRWIMVLAHPLEHEMLFYTSPDMKEWQYESCFGKNIGAQDGVWECPDLFELPVVGTDYSKWVLLCNINPGGPFGGSATQYFIGEFDGTNFKPDTDAEGKVPTKWLDFGKDNYATVSWSDAPDNRRTVIGWMSNWQYAAEVPTKQFRSANTLPRDLSLFVGSDNQIYIKSKPVAELVNLRGGLDTKVKNLHVGEKGRSYALPSVNGGTCEIVLDIDAIKSHEVKLVLSNGQNENVAIVYNVKENTLSFDRHNSGIVDFSQDFPVTTVAPAFSQDGKLSLRIFIDRASIEVFGNDGKTVMTNIVFPTEPYSKVSLSSKGGNAKITGLNIYSIK